MVNNEKLDEILLDLGFSENTRGTEFLRDAVENYAPGQSVTRDIYGRIAKKFGTTGTAVERNIRHAIEKAFTRSSGVVMMRTFGYSLNPDTGRPTNSECISRLWRVCRAD